MGRIIQAADLFCGAGGTSTGLLMAVEAFEKFQADEQALKDQQRREVSRFLGPQYSSNRRKYLDVQSYRANRRRH